MQRIILHVDLKNFFVAVARLQHPEGDQDIIVSGGDQQRSVVCSADYEARGLGVHAGMSITKAKELLKAHLDRTHFCPVDGPTIQKYSHAFKAILATYGKCESFGCDESFVDITQYCQAHHLTAYDCAAQLQTQVAAALQLATSVGISDTKGLAKHNSDILKGGITEIYGRQTDRYGPDPVSHMLWVGPKTAARLNALGVYTIGDLAHYGDQAQLQTALGKHAGIMQGRAQGQDDGDEVDDTPWVPKSVSHVWTFPQDIAFRDANKVQDALEDIVGQVVGELQRLKARGKTITLKVRRHDFYTITRAKTIPATTADFDTILDVVLRLYVQVKDFVMIRLLGVTVSGLEYEK